MKNRLFYFASYEGTLDRQSSFQLGVVPTPAMKAGNMSASALPIFDPKSGATVKEHPDFIKTGDAAIVKVKPTKPLIIEKNSEFPQLAKFAIRDMGQTVAAGICIDAVFEA